MSTPIIETKLARIQTDCNSPDALTATATAYYETTTVIDGQVFKAPWTSVSWRLADTEKTVTVEVAGQPLTLPYAVVSQFVVAVADAEKAAADAPAPVVEPAAEEVAQ